ncbi:MAG: isoprenylcysteine carboxylmethyltransferase family protein [Gammaproteobacteria bacterium]|nr:isoprenylcysteine carboxylmethyltransferase family protein [Gammaproteobacteria bacterium]
MHPLELKLPPLLVVLLTAALIWWLPPLWPLSLLAEIALLLMAAGVVICLWGALSFRLARTTLDPRVPHQSSQLVDGGIYRFTRNPMYLGMALSLLGYGLWLGKGSALLAVVAFVLYLNRFQIIPEERALAHRFGDSFNRYCQRVRRWL